MKKNLTALVFAILVISFFTSIVSAQVGLKDPVWADNMEKIRQGDAVYFNGPLGDDIYNGDFISPDGRITKLSKLDRGLFARFIETSSGLKAVIVDLKTGQPYIRPISDIKLQGGRKVILLMNEY